MTCLGVRKIRRRLEYASGMIAIIIGPAISSYLEIYGKKFLSLDFALNISIIAGISTVLVNISIKIADKGYEKNMDMKS